MSNGPVPVFDCRLAGARPARLRASGGARRHLQRGAAFYLFVLAAIAALAALGLGARGLFDAQADRLDHQERILAEARDAWMAHLLSPDLDATGRRLGEPRLFPDLPIAPGPGADGVEPVYDGLGEPTGCAYRGWTPGAPLIPVATSGAAARCFGRLPWLELGFVPPDGDPTDPQGRIPWLVVSPNLAAPAGCLPDLTPIGLAQAPVAFGCDGRPPYPWIRVVDERGNLLSDRVAFALILPGPARQGQVRTPTAGPAAWLDRIVVLPGCPQPCQPGLYDNAAFNQADGQPTVLISGPRLTAGSRPTGVHAEPIEFNDRLVWVTADDLAVAMERRARRVLSRVLQEFRDLHGRFPFAAALGSSGECVPGLRFGSVAAAPGACGAGESLVLPGWFTAGGWHRYFVYAVSPRCVAGAASCDAPGLVLGADTDVDALVFSPGAPIVTAPFAPSRLAPQGPLLGLIASPLAADYLDSVENAGGTPDVFEPTQGQPAPANDRLEVFR